MKIFFLTSATSLSLAAAAWVMTFDHGQQTAMNGPPMRAGCPADTAIRCTRATIEPSLVSTAPYGHRVLDRLFIEIGPLLVVEETG